MKKPFCGNISRLKAYLTNFVKIFGQIFILDPRLCPKYASAQEDLVFLVISGSYHFDANINTVIQ